jgi:BarA-like signal transduction histidine kinase
MLRTALALCTIITIAMGPAVAQQAKQPTAAQAAQQQRMTSCNANASQRNLKGDARQSYMSSCLSGNMSQTTLMKVCNAEATQEKMTSDDRKAYLATCLKKSA